MIAWNAFGAFGVAAALLVPWAMAARVYLAGPDRLQNRRLAFLLASDGLAIGVLAGVSQLAATEESARWVFLFQGPCSLLLPLSYLAFLATLDIPMVRWLRSRALWAALVPGWVLFAAAVALRPDAFVTGVVPAPPAAWMPVYTAWPLVVANLILAVQLFGLAAAVSLLRRTPRGTPSRSKAKAYVAAFGLRDLGYLVLIGVGLSSLTSGAPGAAPDASRFFLVVAGWPVNTLVFVSLMSYGILRTQLLDIDLRIKRTVRGGTVATMVVAAGLLAAEASRLVLDERASAAVGLAAAVLLVLALTRLGRLAQRVADAAMPGVQDSAGYLDRRRLEVYQAALEETLDGEGEVRPADRALLARLRGELGISDRDHALLAHATQRARRPARGGVALAPGAMALGRYRVLEPLGHGAHGRTVLAEDIELGRRVAIKEVVPGRADAAAVLREARAIAAVQHPHVVTVHDVARAGDQVLMVLEHAAGGSLEARLRRGALAPGELRAVADGLLRGLEAVHAAGIVHRDVKPSNVLLDAAGQAKLADFGVARAPDDEATRGGLQRADHAPGTLRYMAPEQARGRAATARSDLFGAAATLFEACTGRPYLERVAGESAAELQARAAAAGPFARGAEVPEGLRGWFARALDPDPEARFPTAGAMREALMAALGAPTLAGRAPGGPARGAEEAAP